MKRNIILFTVLFAALGAGADNLEVKSFTYAGPYEIKSPVLIDSVDVNKKTFEANSLLSLNIRMNADGKEFNGDFAPSSIQDIALHTLSFGLTNNRYAKAKVNVGGLKQYKVYVDGKEATGESEFEPARHDVVIKYLTQPSEKMDSLKVSVETKDPSVFRLDQSKDGRAYTIYDVIHGERFSGVELSPNGRYIIYAKAKTEAGGKVTRTYYVKEPATGKILDERSEHISWMPRTNKYYYVRNSSRVSGLKTMYAMDPLTRTEMVVAEDIPEYSFTVAPTEDYLIMNIPQEGPKENPDVYEVIEPDDRQTGWRSRNGLAKYDLKSGLLQPLTYGSHDIWLTDVTQDGKELLIMKKESRLTERPTSVFSLYRLNVETLKLDTVIVRDGFISGARYAPDGILVSGTPECLGGVGNVVSEGMTPSMTDNQLYLVSYDGKSVEPLTKQFDPNVSYVDYSPSDGLFYFTAEDRDCVHLYQLNTKTKRIRQITEPEDVVLRFAVANAAGNIVFYGQSASNSDRLYTLNPKNDKSALVEDLSAERLKGIKLGDCRPWTYVNAQGDSICCRYYLPADFDSNKKYPMIVNYYGGCSPTERLFESRYPQHAYAALGYVVLVVNPHGATGFGQEWSAAHVNTAGRGPAEDIIESVKAFCKEHDWVNEKKIGCVGASYGGFMTQYLQTVTDIFAAAVSHAGISDHTSYWGYGYWGYSYSEVSMADSYPWSRKDLFVDQSPLYNADKVHTPLLFIHGDADTNVPVNESIQMYTALKLLGRETAMVLVKGENHHILDYSKRIRWQNTIWAWFAKWLQDDPAWWESMYSEKAL